MKKYFVFMMMSCLLLGGCSENLAVQSMRWAIEALEEGDLRRHVLILRLRKMKVTIPSMLLYMHRCSL